MVPHILIHPDSKKRVEQIEAILAQNTLSLTHPDLLWFGEDVKLGIEEARKIKDFLSLKPYQGKKSGVVVLTAENLTPEAQNALLKTLEESMGETVFILGVSSEEQLLPTIISRCKVINLKSIPIKDELVQKYQKEIDKLLESSLRERFQFVEKLTNKEEFLFALTAYFRLRWNSDLLEDLIQAQRWASRNVNIRAILEYLMLKISSKY